jgi:hypothetical protein
MRHLDRLNLVPRFVANLEAAYRRMWRDWCMERNSDGPESDAA